MQSLEDTQNTYEQRFNCGICMCPKLKMVYGTCQHRICVDCLYDGEVRRSSMDKCPTCQKEDSFPELRPDIPEDNIESQRCLGVRSCSNIGCPMEIWEWEVEEHMRICPNRINSPVVLVKRRHSHAADQTTHRHYRKILRQRQSNSNEATDRLRQRPRRSTSSVYSYRN